MRLKSKIVKIKYWFQRRIRGWSDDETWNLDTEFFEWVSKRFKRYKKLAEKRIVLRDENITFDFKGRKWYQDELIDYIICKANILGSKDVYCFDFDTEYNDFMEAYKILLLCMWW